MFKKKRKVKYPSYLIRHHKRRRDYTESDEAYDLFVKKYKTEPTKEHQRHHINTDRGCGFAHNLIYLHKDTHKSLHEQLETYMMWFIYFGVIKFDSNDPHYYIDNIELINIFNGHKELFKALDVIIKA